MSLVIPCVDIQSGRAVRLYEGDPDKETVYFNSPLEAAQHWVRLGAGLVHLVDLDAATGRGENRAIISEIAATLGVPVEVGGGIRDFEAAQSLLESGISRVVIGTAAVKNPELVSQLIDVFGAERVVVSLDARGGFVAVAGWGTNSDVSIEDLCQNMASRGLRTLIFTDVSRDGTLKGLDRDLMVRVRQAWQGELIVGGGVRDVEDVALLRELGIEGAIVGRSIYEGTLPFPVPV
ncbi:1-(5-phosphoribosyl)-5-[(5-phosphoribosylamino)methylideneamino]imidazole-4-carboxamide isomerase [Deinococcus cellulosilyticus]|uniref:1-(5-phosphoribosyl)-5-[(5-phosphoribosylamino)methylideneamino] imidazole-4-carboxamide isomerase n=1 Tax=Deinococcus cellulosilyticus (strain DSM 18568 / NBRC 106333 / KACC 11606 / 5516J-15) TaxID=1223518 RepID=A0A511N2M1_DEIC1|nr:1-(5-phosphoribosyl)-5-[(5-phosphoribosylamino)methylideneamino]imidazole-4-carboxamide isomerase [Deinococcus cellulosilyticus]GEM47100.1 1-(5-phosphoribosyl)-5-[(5-phosphoribosylamino) methylideneamino] imidazole-4-carboxamide isomerase [Deinococcus cellulosilyticus NBRC 106333 = KACC 11606]